MRREVLLTLAPPEEREPWWPVVAASAATFGLVYAALWLVLHAAAFVFTFGADTTAPSGPALLLASVPPAAIVLSRIVNDLTWRRPPVVRLTASALRISIPTWRTMAVPRRDVTGIVIDPTHGGTSRLGEPVPCAALFNTNDRPNVGIAFARAVSLPAGNVFVGRHAGVTLPSNGALTGGILLRFDDLEQARAAFARWGVPENSAGAFTYDPRSALRGWRLGLVASVVFGTATLGIVALVSAVR